MGISTGYIPYSGHDHPLAEYAKIIDVGNMITCDRCDWTAVLPVTNNNHLGKWELWHDGKPRASGWCIACGDGSVNRHTPNLFANG